MAGRSVRLFLVDGSPTGLRTAEVGMWTGKAVVAPRTEIVALAKREEYRRTGVYLLLGHSDAAPSGQAVYVGEGDDVGARIARHDKDETKDFWTYVVLFVSKDENLTKAHARWLEATLVRKIRDAKRAELKNGTDPIGGALPEANRADMDIFLENVSLLLPTLGADVLSPAEVVSLPSSVSAPEFVLTMRYKNEAGTISDASCAVRDGKFVVKTNGWAMASEVPSLGASSKALRAQLRDKGVLVADTAKPGLLRFTQEYAFDSPSSAAAVVSGVGLNGRKAWKVAGTEQTYGEWVDAQTSTEAEDDGS